MENRQSIVDVEEFMSSPLVTWFESSLNREGIVDKNHKLSFDELVDGVLIHRVFLKMNIHHIISQTTSHADVAQPINGDRHELQRLKNLRTIMRNMRLFYDDDSILLHEPELRLIAHAPHSNVYEIELLLILLLGCAVKCPNRSSFIHGITTLDESTKKIIAQHIAKVTHYPEIALCRDMLLIIGNDESALSASSIHTQNVYKAFEEMQRIDKERLELIEQNETVTSLTCASSVIPHWRFELDEWKSKALQLKSIEEEYAQELRKYAERLEHVERENVRLAKAAKEYRDELDIAMEKAVRVEQFEKEVARYKDKLEQLDMCKSQLEEVKQNNELLNDNKNELVEQLSVYKSKVDRMMKIETQLYKLQEQCKKLALENKSLSIVKEKWERQLQPSYAAGSDESSRKLNVNEMESRVIALESEKQKILRDLEKTQTSLKEKLNLLDVSSTIIQELQVKLQALEKQRKIKSQDTETCNGDELLRKALHEKNTLKNRLREAQLTIEQLRACKLGESYEHNQLELRAKSAQIIELELQNKKLQHQCELLNQLNECGEKDKQALEDYVSEMMKQNYELAMRTLDDKEYFHEEERQHNETMMNLSRAKTKLEEKIIDQFRHMDSRRRGEVVKKRSSAMSAMMKNTLVRVRRAGSEFVGKSKRKSGCNDNNSSPPTHKQVG